MTRKVDEPWTKSKLHRSRLDTSFCTRWSGSSQLASDETLSRTTCPGTELHGESTRSVDQLCEMCPSPTRRSSTHCSADVRVDPVIGFSTGGSGTNVTPKRQRLHSESGEGLIANVEGRIASKEEGSTTTNDPCTTPCTILEPASSATITITRRLRLFVVSILQTETTRKCSDDGRGLVKKFVGTPGKETSAKCIAGRCRSLKKKSVLDAAVIVRCDFVEICRSDAPCLTETTQQRGISSFS